MRILQFTFSTLGAADQQWRHRSAGTWLEDLLRTAGVDMSVTTVTGDQQTVTVSGSSDTLRLACVALNLHAEQGPWDTTPSAQAMALDDYLAREVAAPLQARYNALVSLADQCEERGEREILAAAAQRLADRAATRQGITLVTR